MSIERMVIHISRYTIQFQKKSPGGGHIHQKAPAIEPFFREVAAIQHSAIFIKK